MLKSIHTRVRPAIKTNSLINVQKRGAFGFFMDMQVRLGRYFSKTKRVLDPFDLIDDNAIERESGIYPE